MSSLHVIQNWTLSARRRQTRLATGGLGLVCMVIVRQLDLLNSVTVAFIGSKEVWTGRSAVPRPSLDIIIQWST